MRALRPRLSLWRMPSGPVPTVDVRQRRVVLRERPGRRWHEGAVGRGRKQGGGARTSIRVRANRLRQRCATLANAPGLGIVNRVAVEGSNLFFETNDSTDAAAIGFNWCPRSGCVGDPLQRFAGQLQFLASDGTSLYFGSNNTAYVCSGACANPTVFLTAGGIHDVAFDSANSTDMYFVSGNDVWATDRTNVSTRHKLLVTPLRLASERRSASRCTRPTTRACPRAARRPKRAARVRAAATCEGSTCVCPPTTTACSAACVDLQTSTASCGACGHACLGGACRPMQRGPRS